MTMNTLHLSKFQIDLAKLGKTALGGGGGS